jgi:spermidine/putrescine transport system substrate-binding protein
MVRESRELRRPLSRREFLARAGATGIAVPSLAAILAACADDGDDGGGGGGGGGQGRESELQLARPDSPVTLPVSDANPPIEDGLSPEAGPLRIFGYNDYIWKKVRNQFAAEYGVEVDYTVFDTPEEMVAKLQSGGSDFDLVVTVTLENVGKLAFGELIQPLNKSYLPNLSNVWAVYQDPYYDQGAQYTVPYTVYTTGIGYRNDIVTTDVASMPNPYDVLWDAAYAPDGVHLLNGARDTISAALLRMDADVNTEDANVLDEARQMLLEGVDAMNWKFDHVDYNELGTFAIHQTWSGQVVYYQYYLPDDLGIEAFSYVWPPKAASGGPGIITNDLFAIPKGAQSPVLAHAMIDWLSDPDNALLNYSYEGFQPPIDGVTPESILAEGLVPENLANVLITEEDFPLGVQQLELPPATNQLWQQIYTEVTGGA